MIISFAHTTPALLAGAKTVTRRDWKPKHAAKFKAGMIVDAWDRSPRVKGSRKVAVIRITRDPHLAWSTDITEADELAEGFVWMRGHGQGDVVDAILANWHQFRTLLYVVEFELVEVVLDSRRSAPAPRGETPAPSQPQYVRGRRD